MVPHNHLVIAADSISSGTMEVFREHVRSYQGQVWNPKKHRYEESDWQEGVAARPTTQTFHIEAREDYANILDYLVVPVDLVTPYRAAWQLARADQRQSAILLNQNVTEALAGLELFTRGRDGHFYRGRFHHKSGGFLGVAKRIRETRQHDRRVAALLQDCNDANLAAFPFERKHCVEEQSSQCDPQSRANHEPPPTVPECPQTRKQR
jgi:hypothetical protein